MRNPDRMPDSVLSKEVILDALMGDVDATKTFMLDFIGMMGPCTNGDLINAMCSYSMVDEDGYIRTFDADELLFMGADLWMGGAIRVLNFPQIDEFDLIVDIPEAEPMRDMTPIRMVELFAGIGAVRKAMTNLRIPHTSVISEINKYSVLSYNAIHGPTENLGDISKVERLPDCDLLVYGFPCQDISIAGNMRGFEKGSGTRSSLLWEVGRLLEAYGDNLPNTLIMENVKNLISKKNLPRFNAWIGTLSAMGYTSSWQVLNAVDYGVCQNRERVFLVSTRSGSGFEFPKPTTPGGDGGPKLRDIVRHVPCNQWRTLPMKEAPLEHDRTKTINTEGLRALTPTECWALMGFSIRDCYRAMQVCSDAQIYKQAGNSIVVDVLEGILSCIYLKTDDRALRKARQTLLEAYV